MIKEGAGSPGTFGMTRTLRYDSRSARITQDAETGHLYSYD